MRAGLAASTVTPGITAPEVSFTTPAIALCAEATAGSTMKTKSPRTARHRNPGLCMVAPCDETSAAPTRYKWVKSTARRSTCQSKTAAFLYGPPAVCNESGDLEPSRRSVDSTNDSKDHSRGAARVRVRLRRLGQQHADRTQHIQF